MYKLFLDTHSEKVTIGFIKDEELFVRTVESSKNHSEVCVPLLKEMLGEKKITLKDFDEILVVNGPGSFTGIRIGITIAKVIACSLNIKIKAISSLVCYLVSDDNKDEKTSVIEENNGFYYSIMKDNKILKEDYSDDIDKLSAMNNIVNNDLDILKIYEYSKNIGYENPYTISANYIKKIEAEK